MKGSAMFKSFKLMLQFLTRLPLKPIDDVTEADFTRGLILFPAVGAVIGLVLMSTQYLLKSLTVGPLLTAAIVVAVSVIMTGGLHLDGLADAFDGLYSNRSRERILEIMKDSHIGTFGVLALIILMMLKGASLAELYVYKTGCLLLLMPIYGRFCGVLMCYRSSSPRANGMGNMFIGKLSDQRLLIMTAMVIVVSAVYPKALILLGVNILFTFMYRMHVIRVIGGITGDIIGSTIELNELVFILFSVLLKQIIL